MSPGVRAVPTTGLPGSQLRPGAPVAFSGLTQDHCRFPRPPAGRGIGSRWCLWQSLVMLGAAPSRAARPAPARAIPREDLPAGSTGRAALPMVVCPHRGQREGRDLHQDVSQPETSAHQRSGWLKTPAELSVGFFSKRAAEHKCVSMRVCVHAFHRDRCRGECNVTRPHPAPAAAQPGMARLHTPELTVTGKFSSCCETFYLQKPSPLFF